MRCIKFIPGNVKFKNERRWPVLSQPGQLRDLLRTRAGNMLPFRVIYQPAPYTDVEQHFDLMCQMARAAENMVLYIDEIDQLCSSGAMTASRSHYWNLPENKTRRRPLDDLFDSGRHAGLAVVMMTRNPSQVNTKVRLNSREMRIFRTSEEGAIEYFTPKLGRKIAQQLPSLGDYEYILWQDGKPPIITGGKRK